MATYFVSFATWAKQNYDGVNLAQREIKNAVSRLNLPLWRVLPEKVLFNSNNFFSRLTSRDTIYCNADPYAYLLFLAREEVSGDFRIVRNVQTGPWNGYLFQEWVCGPMTRPGDIVLYISHYALDVFTRGIPSLCSEGRHVVCYPEVNDYPQLHEIPPLHTRRYHAAYIGRISRDKGFDKVIETFQIIHSKEPQSRFLVLGTPHHLDYTSDEIANFKAIGRAIGITFLSSVPRQSVFGYLLECRCLLFPSTSNVESLGRIVLEACHCGTPVVAADHGEMPVLLSSKNLVASNYTFGLCRPTSAHFPMGSPSPLEIAGRVLGRRLSVSRECLEFRRDHWTPFMSMMNGNVDLMQKSVSLSSRPNAAFFRLNSIPSLDLRTAVDVSRKVKRVLNDLVEAGSTTQKIFKELLSQSSYPERTHRFVDSFGAGRFSLDDIGQVPIELCHFFDFDPELEILSCDPMSSHSNAKGL